MSWSAVDFVLALDLPSSTKFVAVVLAKHIKQETGRCWPGQKLLAEEASLSDRQIRLHIKRLVDELGVYAKHERRRADGMRTSDEYELIGYLEWSGGSRQLARDIYRKNSSGSSGNVTGRIRSGSPEESGRGHRKNSSGQEREVNDQEQSAYCPNPQKRLTDDEQFEEYWSGYPDKQNNSKAKAKSEWYKLTRKEREQAVRSLPRFSKYCQEHPDYRVLHAWKYLSEKRFASFPADCDKDAADVQLHGVKLTPDMPEWAAWREWMVRNKMRVGLMDRVARGEGPGGLAHWSAKTRWPPGYDKNGIGNDSAVSSQDQVNGSSPTRAIAGNSNPDLFAAGDSSASLNN